MPEQLNRLIESLSSVDGQVIADVRVSGILFVMSLSLICSMFISYLYVTFYSSRATGSHIHRAFPLLGISITAIFICIQFSLPLSLGLLGALSIVRFRTPIKEPEEIGFLMLVIAASLACATFNFIVLGIVLAIAVAALLIKQRGPRFLGSLADDGLLIISLPEQEYEAKDTEVMEVLSSELVRGQLDSISKNGEEMVISYAFQGLGPDAFSALQSRLKDVVGSSNLSILFNRPGAL